MLELEEIIERSKAAKLRKRSLREYLCTRRWLQFSLRTLIIFIAIICIGIALTINWIIPSEMQRRAANVIELTGGTYAFEGEKLGIVMNPEEYSTFYSVKSNTHKTHSWHKHYFKRIEEVYLQNYVSGKHSPDWTALPKLRKLVVDDANNLYSADYFLQEIKKLNQIKSLEIANLSLSSEGIRAISQFDNLESLAFDIAHIEKDEMTELTKMKNLRSLTIFGGSQERIDLLQNFSNIKSVRVLVPTYGRIEIQRIVVMPRLEELDLVNSAVTEEDLQRLFWTCESFKTIRVKKSLQESLSQKTLDHFKKHQIAIVGE